MGALKFFGTIVLKFKSIVFKFKSIHSGIILFFREIKTLFSTTSVEGATKSVEGATSAENFIYRIVNLIRIWFEYVKDHLPEFITIITILIIVVVIFSIKKYIKKHSGGTHLSDSEKAAEWEEMQPEKEIKKRNEK